MWFKIIEYESEKLDKQFRLNSWEKSCSAFRGKRRDKKQKQIHDLFVDELMLMLLFI